MMCRSFEHMCVRVESALYDGAARAVPKKRYAAPMKTHADIQQAAQQALKSLKTRCYIDGQFIDPASGESYDRVNPATGTALA